MVFPKRQGLGEPVSPFCVYETPELCEAFGLGQCRLPSQLAMLKLVSPNRTPLPCLTKLFTAIDPVNRMTVLVSKGPFTVVDVFCASQMQVTAKCTFDRL
jgi:hypothetical protein